MFFGEIRFKYFVISCWIGIILLWWISAPISLQASEPILKAESYHHYINDFNQNDNECYQQLFPNDKAWEFLSQNIPFLDYPDKEIEKTYYFRWWTFRKHLKKSTRGRFIVTEFLPSVGWAGEDNAIACPLAHHFREGRWLHDDRFLSDYAEYWLEVGDPVRMYSSMIAESVRQLTLVTGKNELAYKLLPAMINNYNEWEKTNLDPNGLFWQTDNKDGMEVSVGGSGYRVTINSYMYAEASAIAEIGRMKFPTCHVADKFQYKADQLKKTINESLWDEESQFYKVAYRESSSDRLPKILRDVRELHGYTPWYVVDASIPPVQFDVCWNQLMDPKGFYAPYGPTTTEQRHPGFRVSYFGHECQWNGPSWPFATSITLTALANLINAQRTVDQERNQYYRNMFLSTLKIYTNSQRRITKEGIVLPWIDEDLNPYTGDWIARTCLSQNNGGKNFVERGKDYNHSTYCDLIINGLIGFRPSLGEYFDLFPIVPKEIPYFCLDHIMYHGKKLSIVYDKEGTRYRFGQGLHVLIDGAERYSAKELPSRPIRIAL